jgi:hypothetical protein
MSRILGVLLAVGVFVVPGVAQNAGKDLSDTQVSDIIRKFSHKESEFAKARELYTYRQTVRILDIAGGRTVGRHEVTSDIVFTGDGKRTERVVKAPVPDLKNFLLDPDDEKDLRSVQPFVLTSTDIDKYYVRYLGKEVLDEIPCYAFAVKPKALEKDKRYFSGIIWVDDRDLQIVKSYGRGVGIQRKGSAYPKFETYREQVDGKYWFPTYTIADSDLQFEDNTAHIRMTVKYEDYKQFKAESTITFEDPVDDKPAATPNAPLTAPKTVSPAPSAAPTSKAAPASSDAIGTPAPAEPLAVSSSTSSSASGGRPTPQSQSRPTPQTQKK